METPETAETRARVAVALALTLRDGGLRISEAAALAWSDVERWPDGSGRLTIRRSKTDPAGEGAVVAITPPCVRSLEAIRPEDPEDQASVFQLTARQRTNRIKAACQAAGLDGDTFSGHSGRVGLAQMMSGTGAPTETTMKPITQDKVQSFLRAETRKLVNNNARKLASAGFTQQPSRPTLFRADADEWKIYADLDSTEVMRIWEVDCLPGLYAFPEDTEPPR